MDVRFLSRLNIDDPIALSLRFISICIMYLRIKLRNRSTTVVGMASIRCVDIMRLPGEIDISNIWRCPKKSCTGEPSSHPSHYGPNNTYYQYGIETNPWWLGILPNDFSEIPTFRRELEVMGVALQFHRLVDVSMLFSLWLKRPHDGKPKLNQYP